MPRLVPKDPASLGGLALGLGKSSGQLTPTHSPQGQQKSRQGVEGKGARKGGCDGRPSIPGGAPAPSIARTLGMSHSGKHSGSMNWGLSQRVLIKGKGSGMDGVPTCARCLAFIPSNK